MNTHLNRLARAMGRRERRHGPAERIMTTVRIGLAMALYIGLLMPSSTGFGSGRAHAARGTATRQIVPTARRAEQAGDITDSISRRDRVNTIAATAAITMPPGLRHFIARSLFPSGVPTVVLSAQQGLAGGATEVSACGFVLPASWPPPPPQSFTIPGITFTVQLDAGTTLGQVSQSASYCADGSVGFGVGTSAAPLLATLPTDVQPGAHSIAVSWNADSTTATAPFTVYQTSPPTSTTVITFDDVAPGGNIPYDRYRAMGVDLSARTTTVVAVDHGLAQSGTQVLQATSGSSEFPTPDLEGTFAQTRQQVWVYVGDFNPGETTRVSLTAYDTSHNVVGMADAPITGGQGFHTRLAVASTRPDIASFVIRGAESNKAVGVDDLSFDNPPLPPQPDFSVSDPSHGLPFGLRQGYPRDLALTVQRFNGSTGDLQFSMDGLPPGVTASFTPNPTDAANVTLMLTAASDAPITYGVPVSIIATPSSPSAGAAPHAVRLALSVVANLSIANMTVDVPPCSSASAGVLFGDPGVSVEAPFQFDGTIDLALDRAIPGVQITLDPTTVSFAHGASAEPVLRVTASPGALGVDTTLHIVATNPQFAPITGTITLHPIAGTIGSFSPHEGDAPMLLGPSTEVAIHGSGFCSGTTVQFGNPQAIATPHYISVDGQELRVHVPRLATDGPLTVVTPGGNVSSPTSFAVHSYRNTNGFSFSNWTPSDVVFDDLTDEFGEDQTYDHVDPCGAVTFGWINCSIVKWHDPVAAVVLSLARHFLTAAGSGGVCFGMSRTSLQIFQRDKAPWEFSPHTVHTAYQLDGPGGPSPELRHYILLQALSQVSAEFLHYWLGQVAENVFRSSSDIYNQVHDALASGYPPMIALRDGSEGHVVVAYDLEDDGQGGFYIDVYDSNRPFDPAENTAGLLHQQVEQASRIHVTADGHWSFQMDTSTWSGRFSSLGNSLVVIPYGVIPLNHPTLPTGLEGLKVLIFGTAGHGPAPTLVQLTDGAGHSLLGPNGQLNADPRTRLVAAPFVPLNGRAPSDTTMYLIGGDGAITQTVRDSGSGTYSATLLGRGLTVQVDGISSNPGVTDQLSLNPRTGSFGFRTAAARKPLSVTLTARLGDGSVRTAIIHTTSFKGAGDSIAFDRTGQALTLHHTGPAITYRVELSWVGAHGLPGSTASQMLRIGGGTTAIVAPSDWHHLDSTNLLLTLVRRNGTRSHTTLRSRPALAPVVGIDALQVDKARSTGTVFSVHTHLHRAAATSYIVFVWTLARNGHAVGHHTVLLSGAHMGAGRRLDRWYVDPHYSGRYKVTVSVMALSGGLTPHSEVQQRSLMVTVR